ncbi:MAG: protein tyrosine phosphatase family protein, partial [Gammaproteobacteria bacterium]
EDIFNFVSINEQISTGGQPTQEQFEAAREEGYTAVINLAPVDAENNALEDEEGLLASLGLDYVHIPMIWDDPKPEQFNAFCSAMEKVGNQKVLIHCAANYRVSAVISSYAIKHLGWSVKQADSLVNKIWTSVPEYPMNDTWQTYIDTIRGD